MIHFIKDYGQNDWLRTKYTIVYYNYRMLSIYHDIQFFKRQNIYEKLLIH